MSNDKLKPCPFCGEPPKLTERPDNSEGTQFFCAVGCFCGSYSATAHRWAVRPTAAEAKAVAVAEWNTRHGAAHEAEKQAGPMAHLWQHGETGRTRIVMPDQVVTADANWFIVGPLYLHPAPPSPLTERDKAENALLREVIQEKDAALALMRGAVEQLQAEKQAGPVAFPKSIDLPDDWRERAADSALALADPETWARARGAPPSESDKEDAELRATSQSQVEAAARSLQVLFGAAVPTLTQTQWESAAYTVIRDAIRAARAKKEQS